MTYGMVQLGTKLFGIPILGQHGTFPFQ
jgi:hypothetical protein